MADKVTAEMVRSAHMTMVAAVDMQGSYRNVYRCVEFPELMSINEGPKRRHPKIQAKATTTFTVADVEVPANNQAIADAINTYREGRTSDE